MEFQKIGADENLEENFNANFPLNEVSNSQSKQNSFLLSALTTKNKFQNIEDFLSWFNSRKQVNEFEVKEVPFRTLDKWCFDEISGNLKHESGKFFSIKGIKVIRNSENIGSWDQPIIDQPEIGILGIITKVFEGTRYFLMQAKMEPGNINTIQLSPTVQATKSNYTQTHGGSKTLYLDYFIDKSRSKIIVDQLQTEQGARFLRKRNRNMIIEVSEDFEIHEDFIWLTLGEIKKLLTIDNLVNMDSRSVISCIDYVDEELREKYESLGKEGILNSEPFTKITDSFKKDLFISMIDKKNSSKTINELINWLTELKSQNEATVKEIPLKDVSQWIKKDFEIKHESGKFFSVIGISCKASNREVKGWDQPLIKQSSYGMVGFITKNINGILHFLVQGRVDPCSFNTIEIVPTVACTEAKYKMQNNNIPFLDLFMTPDPKKIKYWSTQSEEGGRFYQSQNSYVVIKVDETKSLKIPENYTWMTFGQIMDLTKHNYFNIDIRGLMACLSFI